MMLKQVLLLKLSLQTILPISDLYLKKNICLFDFLKKIFSNNFRFFRFNQKEKKVSNQKSIFPFFHIYFYDDLNCCPRLTLLW